MTISQLPVDLSNIRTLWHVVKGYCLLSWITADTREYTQVIPVKTTVSDNIHHNDVAQCADF